MSEDRSLLLDIESFVRKFGRAPSTDEVRELAEFDQPGGIERLCEALSRFGQGYLIVLKRTGGVRA